MGLCDPHPGHESYTVKFRDLASRMPLIVAVFSGITACSQEVEQPVEPAPFVTSDPGLRAAMLEEEDARCSGGSGIESLRLGLSAPETELQRVEVRAIGRLEDREVEVAGQEGAPEAALAG